MLILSAFLAGTSVACAVWLIIRWRQSRRLVAGRITDVSASFLYDKKNEPPSVVKLEWGEGALGVIGSSKITRDLFLAGFRTKQSVRFFIYLTRLSVILPVCLILLYAFTGSFRWRSLIMAVLAGVIIFLYINIFVGLLKRQRQAKILKNLPQFLDLIVVCVEAGVSFTGALERILKESDSREPLTQEFSLMYYEFLGGLTLAQACGRMDQRCEVPDLSLLLSSIVQSDQMGASLGHTLRMQATELRDKLRQRVRTRAFQVPVKILFPTLLIFLSFMILNLAYIGYQIGIVLGNNTNFTVRR